jgi:alkylation response protein AidB-like acyl-CoA dehydrogenase
MGDIGREGLVHVRGTRERAGAARAHESGPEGRARGLSLFIVPKDAFPGHEFEMRQPAGGVLPGQAAPTPGDRGMHSFTLGFER